MKKTQKEKGAAQLYLEQIEKLEVQIDRKRDKAERLYCLATKSTAGMNAGGASGGGNCDKMGNAADGHMDLLKEIEKDEADLKALISDTYDLMAKLRREHYDVLRLRYMHYMTFDDIARAMNYSSRGIRSLHGRALQVFGKVLEERRRKQNDTV